MNSALNMRPFQIILLVVFALMALVGLFLFANYSGLAGSSSKIGTVVIWGTLPQDAVQNEISTISGTNKSFSKVTYVHKDPTTFDADLANAIASGVGPDLVIINQEQLLTEQSKLDLIPYSSVPQRTFTSTFLPEDGLYLATNGTYGVPYMLDPMVLYYNQTLLNSAGVAQVPTTWEALTGLTPTLTHLAADQSLTQSTVAFGEYANIENARAILSLLLLQSGTPITQASQTSIRSTLGASGASTADGSTPAVAAVNFYTQFSDSSRTVYSWNASFPSAQQAFLGGTLAFYPGFASEEPVLKAANPNLAFNMSPIPAPDTATNKVDYGLAYAFAIPKASPNKVGAFKVIQGLIDPTVLQGAAMALSMVPANRSLLTPNPSDQFGPVFYPEALVSQGWLSPAPATTDTIFSAMITNITSGRYGAVDALYAADQALDAALPSSQ